MGQGSVSRRGGCETSRCGMTRVPTVLDAVVECVGGAVSALPVDPAQEALAVAKTSDRGLG